MAIKPDAPSERTRVKRGFKRAKYDRQTVCDILDAVPMCNVAFVLDGMPVVTPTSHWREGDHVYWHGSTKSRLIKKCAGKEVCLSVSLLDGMVMGRSAMNHSANYRSVMLFGKASLIKDRDEKREKLKGMIETLFPGRWDMLRPITDKELKATAVLCLPVDEASAKIRTGFPVDDEEDYALPIWGGVLPISMQMGAPIDDPRNLEGVEMPPALLNFKIG